MTLLSAVVLGTDIFALQHRQPCHAQVPLCSCVHRWRCVSVHRTMCSAVETDWRSLINVKSTRKARSLKYYIKSHMLENGRLRSLQFNSIQFNFIFIAPNHNKHYLEAFYKEGQDLKAVSRNNSSHNVQALWRLWREKPRCIHAGMQRSEDG